ncbi:MAG: hypothetical protein KDJ43_04150 [Rhizobiaceae bacterium]|nr:hypothetical protein [Rhizobiaceae bacterium]
MKKILFAAAAVMCSVFAVPTPIAGSFAAVGSLALVAIAPTLAAAWTSGVRGGSEQRAFQRQEGGSQKSGRRGRSCGKESRKTRPAYTLTPAQRMAHQSELLAAGKCDYMTN